MWSRKINNSKDFISGSLLLTLGCFIFARSLWLPVWSQIGPQEGFFPLAVAMIMIGTSLSVISRAFGPSRAPEMMEIQEKGQANMFRMLSYAIFMVLFAILMDKVGFLISSTLFLVLILKFVEKQNWKITIWIGCASIMLSYLIFVYFLGVPLPKTLSRLL